MAMTKLFYNQSSGTVYIVTFARDNISDRATGPLIAMTRNEFLNSGTMEIDKQLTEFYDRDASIPSELYQTMPQRERNVFLKKNSVVNISWNNQANFVKIYAGPNLDFVQKSPFPLKSPDFTETLIRILEKP
jgi:hypothetical protein